MKPFPETLNHTIQLQVLSIERVNASLGSSASAARPEHQADPRSPRSRQLAGPGCAAGLPDPRRRQLDQSTRQVSGAQERTPCRPGCAVGLSDPRHRQLDQSTRQISGAREQAARGPWECCRPSPILASGRSISDAREHGRSLEPAGSPTPAARSGAAPAVFQSSGAGSSPDIGALQPSRFSAPAARSEHQGALRIFDVGSSIRAPERSPKPRSGHLACPGCAAASWILSTDCTVRAPRRISKVQEWAIPPPGCAASLPRSSPLAARSKRQADLRNRGAGTSRAPDALQPPGFSAPAARSEHPSGSPKSRSGQFPLLAVLKLSGSSKPTTRPKYPAGSLNLRSGSVKKLIRCYSVFSHYCFEVYHNIHKNASKIKKLRKMLLTKMILDVRIAVQYDSIIILLSICFRWISMVIERKSNGLPTERSRKDVGRIMERRKQ